MTYLATAALLLIVVTLPLIGGALLAPFLVGLFLLALNGVLAARATGGCLGETRRSTRADGAIAREQPPRDVSSALRCRRTRVVQRKM